MVKKVEGGKEEVGGRRDKWRGKGGGGGKKGLMRGLRGKRSKGISYGGPEPGILRECETNYVNPFTNIILIFGHVPVCLLMSIGFIH